MFREIPRPYGPDQTTPAAGNGIGLRSEGSPGAASQRLARPRRLPDGSIDFDFYRGVAGQERHWPNASVRGRACGTPSIWLRHLAAQLRRLATPRARMASKNA